MAQPFTDDTSEILRQGRIKTSSRIRKIWLSFRGYKVEKRVQTPMGYSLGRLTYRTSWVLRRMDAK